MTSGQILPPAAPAKSEQGKNEEEGEEAFTMVALPAVGDVVAMDEAEGVEAFPGYG